MDAEVSAIKALLEPVRRPHVRCAGYSGFEKKVRVMPINADLGIETIRSINDLDFSGILGRQLPADNVLDLTINRITVSRVHILVFQDITPNFTIFYRDPSAFQTDNLPVSVLDELETMDNNGYQGSLAVVKHTPDFVPLNIQFQDLYFIRLLVDSFLHPTFFRARFQMPVYPAPCSAYSLLPTVSPISVFTESFPLELSDMILDSTSFPALYQLSKNGTHSHQAVQRALARRILRYLEGFVDSAAVDTLLGVLHSPTAVIFGDFAQRVLRGSTNGSSCPLLEIAHQPHLGAFLSSLFESFGFGRMYDEERKGLKKLVRGQSDSADLKTVMLYESHDRYPISVALRMGISTMACAITASAIYDFCPEFQAVDACVLDRPDHLTKAHRDLLASLGITYYRYAVSLADLSGQNIPCGQACQTLWRRISVHTVNVLSWRGLRQRQRDFEQPNHALDGVFCACELDFLNRNHLAWRIGRHCFNQECRWIQEEV